MSTGTVLGIMVKRLTLAAVVKAAKFHIKVRTLWTKARPQRLSREALARKFAQAVNSSEAPLLRALAQKVDSVRYSVACRPSVGYASELVFR